jgi:hypothetical protein
MANGNGYSNGNNNGLFAPWKTIGLSITAAIGITSVGLTLQSERLQEHADEMAQLRADMYAKTDQRYRVRDATRDFKVVNARIDRVEVRDDRCETRMNLHLKGHEAR